MNYKNSIILFAIMAFFVLPAHAENSTKVDGYAIHHNAITTDTLLPDIAKAYGIVRSRNRAMINISLIKEKKGTTGTPTAANVKATLKRLTGQQQEIPLKEIKEGDAIYYIGVFGIVHGENVRFNIQVTPQGSQNTYQAKLAQQFFSN